MSLIKLAANRMTKEKMHGRLSDKSLNQILKADSTVSTKSTLGRNQENFIPRQTLRTSKQMAIGINKGNEILAAKEGYKTVDIPDWHRSHTMPHVKGLAKKIVEKSGHKGGTVVYAKHAKDDLMSAIAGRHEVFEAQEMGKDPIGLGTVLRGKKVRSIMHNGRLVGRHANLRVLGKESNLLARQFHQSEIKPLTSIRDRNEETSVAKLFKKEYGNSQLTKKELKQLADYKPTRILNQSSHNMKDVAVGKAGIDHNKIIKTVGGTALAIGGTLYVAKKIYDYKHKKKGKK